MIAKLVMNNRKREKKEERKNKKERERERKKIIKKKMHRLYPYSKHEWFNEYLNMKH